VLLNLFLTLEFLPVLPQILQLPLLSLALSVCIILCFLGHLQLMPETTLHFLGCFSLTLDGSILLLELSNFSSEFLTGSLGAIVEDFSLSDFSCELVEDLLILH
jgi:uncharacterized membrane protein YbhN (UPF0104 family)